MALTASPKPTTAARPSATPPASTSPRNAATANLRILAVAAVALASILFALHRAHFDWATFFAQLRLVAWVHIAAGIALIYATYWLRAWRWAEFCRPVQSLPDRRVHARDLLGPQFVGFTAVALFGRLADLARPLIISRRTGLPLPSQIAVYTVERIFDLGAAAVVFSSALAFTPAGLPHRDRLVRVGVGSLVVTLAMAAFAVAIRLHGDRIAALAGRLLARLSPRFAAGIEEKILGFRSGLQAISTVREFLLAAGISVAMWLMIGGAYWQTAHSFAHTPELATLSFSRTMLLMAASLGGSLLQLPGLGWFTQIAATAAAMHAFYGAPLEAATACGAMLLIVTSLSIVPAGLLFARLEGISLRQTTATSEATEAELSPDPFA